MSKKLYLDTNIWLDYCLKSQDITPLDEYANHIFERALNCEFSIVISDIVLFELERKNFPKDIFTPFIIKNKLIFVSSNNDDQKLARVYNVHYPDRLHIHLAKKHNCDFLVTNDKEMLYLSTDIRIVDSPSFQFS